MATTRLEGAEVLSRRIALLQAELRASALADATDEGADVLVQSMKRYAPRRTGIGQESIDKEPVPQKSPNRADVDVGPGSDGFYLIFHEIGTSKMTATPFMRPALDQSRGEIVEAVRKSLELRVLKVAR